MFFKKISAFPPYQTCQYAKQADLSMKKTAHLLYGRPSQEQSIILQYRTFQPFSAEPLLQERGREILVIAIPPDGADRLRQLLIGLPASDQGS